jgi:endonuclease/exonuclease/phosphatase family metal-dependent hydrolase
MNLFSRRRLLPFAAAAVLAPCALATLALAILTSCRTSAEAPSALRLRVMTYNIHHGEGADGVVDLARIAGVIQREAPDLVGLQEVDKGVARTQGRDFPAELAALTGMTCVFSNNFHYQGGDYGNAVLTRLPIERWTNTHLRMLRPNEQRGVLQVVVRAGARHLLFMNTHIDYRRDDAERLVNVAQFKEIVAGYAGLPIVFVGDFNSLPDSRPHAAMSELFDDVWPLVGAGPGFTITSTAPHSRIDYVWLSRAAPLKPVRAWIPTTTASDHLPLVVDFEWP